MCKRAVGLASVHGGYDPCWMSHCAVGCDAGGDKGVVVMGRQLAATPGPGHLCALLAQVSLPTRVGLADTRASGHMHFVQVHKVPGPCGD